MCPASHFPAFTTESAPSPHAAFETRVAGTHVEGRQRVLKHGDTFAVFDQYGDISPLGQKGETGIYHRGTRFLSRLLLTIDGTAPLLLNSAVDEEDVELTVDLTNSAPNPDDSPQGTLHIRRAKLLYDGTCLEEMYLTSFARTPLTTTVSLHVGADFADVFEVRGLQRSKRGDIQPAEINPDGLTLPYAGLDGVVRRTQISADPAPAEVTPSRLDFTVELFPQQPLVISIRIHCRGLDPGPGAPPFDQARKRVAEILRVRGEAACRVRTESEPLNSLLSRAFADVLMMTTETRYGPYPYAGVPWYSTPFGRDGIITALECLWMAPNIARGVLSFLAAHQADRHDPSCDCEPGKIVHEMRDGEMAALGEVPFGRYYGSVDSTPLFVLLAAEYFTRTADRDFIRGLWPNIERALTWMTDFGDLDGDGFIEYSRRSSDGLLHQGWKDSHDSVFHLDGSDAIPPIALCEVQGYAYAAFLGAAMMATELGDFSMAERLSRRAERLRRDFQAAFWCDDLGTFALALDGRKHPCRVRTSNAGQCLFTGIAERWQAERLSATLLDSRHYSGWGIRTVDERELRYNPMSYHNGSVWPHDNALIAAGFSRYGMVDEVRRIMSDVLAAAAYMDVQRLPELFCGFPRRRGQGPTLYPVACSPQVWASAAAFSLIQSCISLRADALQNRITLSNPRLPATIAQLNLLNLRVGATSLDLRLHRFNGDVGLHVTRKDGDAEVAVLK